MAPKVGRKRSRCIVAGSSVGGTCFFRTQTLVAAAFEVPSENSLHCRRREWDKKTTLRLRPNRAPQPMGVVLRWQSSAVEKG